MALGHRREVGLAFVGQPADREERRGLVPAHPVLPAGVLAVGAGDRVPGRVVLLHQPRARQHLLAELTARERHRPRPVAEHVGRRFGIGGEVELAPV